jgi:archaemetzincin
MTVSDIIIGVLAIGEVPKDVLKVIAAHITGYLNLNTEILPGLEHPSYAHDPQRQQYDAGIILSTLESMPAHEQDKIVGVLNVDLFVPIFTHVFGEAREGGKYAVVSMHRLSEISSNRKPLSPQTLERTAKVALHELGHLFNRVHCQDNRCIMQFMGRVEDIDKIPPYFCRYCAETLPKL